MTGFLSSAVFGTFLGIYVDSWGRKTGVVIFCVLEVTCSVHGCASSAGLFPPFVFENCTVPPRLLLVDVQIVINLLEHVPSMPILLLGRVLGGLSTSLLFTAFESWMVSEHRRQGFDETLLESTFSIASAGNGIAAIAAGIFAQTAAGKTSREGILSNCVILAFALVVSFSFPRSQLTHCP